MKPQWIRRRAHTRRLLKGGATYVRANWALRCSKGVSKSGSYRHPCPHCGASVTSVHMPNGGWAHFEGGKGLGRVKHPCLHIGDGLSKKRDDQTGDLFDRPQTQDLCTEAASAAL